MGSMSADISGISTVFVATTLGQVPMLGKVRHRLAGGAIPTTIPGKWSLSRNQKMLLLAMDLTIQLDVECAGSWADPAKDMVIASGCDSVAFRPQLPWQLSLPITSIKSVNS